MTMATSSHPRWYQALTDWRNALSRWLPDDWRTAAATLDAMNHTAGDRRRAYPHSMLGFGVPFVSGAVFLGYFTDALAHTTPTVPMGVMAALLAFSGLLVGFVVTLMLFTGRLQSPDDLGYEMAVAYATRIKYLLASQAKTLFSALLMAVLATVWMLLYATQPPLVALQVVGGALGGFGAVCLCRMMLLPMQIFELHEDALDRLVEAKRKATIKRHRN